MINKRSILTGILLFAVIGLAIALAAISGENSLDNPVIFNTASGGSGKAAPYIYVKNTSTYSYSAVIEGADQKKKYAFEDSTDNDFNDVIVDLEVTGNFSPEPVLAATILSLDASYDHEIWLRIDLPDGYDAIFGQERYTGDKVDIKIFASSQQSAGQRIEIKIIPKDLFNISVNPSELTLQRGSDGKYTFDVEFKPHFSGEVLLKLDNLPRHITAEFEPVVVRGTGGQIIKSVLNVHAGINAPTGKYKLTVIASTTGETETIEIFLKILEKPDFILSISPDSCGIEPGGAFNFNIKIIPVAGFTNTVSLKIEGLPQNLKAAITPDSIKGEGSATLSVTAAPDSEIGTYKFKIIGSSGELSHSAEVSVDVFKYFPEISITKSADKNNVTVGEEVTFRINLINSGDIVLNDVIVTDKLHEALEFISSNPKASTDNQNLSFTLGELKPGAQNEIQIKVRIRQDAGSAPIISNFATVKSDRTDAKRSNIVTLTLGRPSLTLLKQIKNINANFRPGGIVIYEIIAENRGSAPLYNIKISDELPNGFYYLKERSLVNGSIVKDPVIAGNTILWSFESLDPGRRIQLVYQVSISSSVKSGRHLNSAEIYARDGAGREVHAGPAQAIVTVSRGSTLLWSSIEGIVFEDLDGDEYFGAEDQPLENIEVLLDNGEIAVTDKEGIYLFDSILPGEHVVSIDPRKLSDNLEAAKLFYLINVIEGSREYQDFPILSRDEGAIEGKIIWQDRQEAMPPVSMQNIKLLLNDKYYAETDENGKYSFRRVPVGEHIIALHIESIPQGLRVSSENPAGITVKKQETVNVDFILLGNPFGTIEGRITATKKDAGGADRTIPIAGIKFTLDNGTSVFSDSEGKFRFVYIIPGIHKLAIDKEALEKRYYRLKTPDTIELKIQAGMTQIVNIEAETVAFLEIKINKNK